MKNVFEICEKSAKENEIVSTNVTTNHNKITTNHNKITTNHNNRDFSLKFASRIRSDHKKYLSGDK